MPSDPGDALTLLQATWEASQQMLFRYHHVNGTDRGRPLGRRRVFGSVATFATVGAASAPGQVPVDELKPVLEALRRFSGR